MTRQEIIQDKIRFFLNQQSKVHLVTVPSIRFPKGKFYNGIIIQVFDNFILFNDPIEDRFHPTKIFISEIDDIEEYNENKRGEDNG